MRNVRPLKAALLATLLLNASATAMAGDWISDAKNGCKVWNPHPSPGETVSWSGACKDGLADGKGILYWLRGGTSYERDEGEWRGGRQTGAGTQSWAGGKYNGDVFDGLPHGNGLLIFGEAAYRGAFLNGIPSGSGTLTNASGTFSGTWSGGCFNDGKHRAAIGISIGSCP